MKKAKVDRRNERGSEMLQEYDFTEGARGRHYRAYQKGHKVKIRRGDGTTIVQHYKMDDGAVLLAPDVREYFPDADAVNNALRTLIRLIPRKPQAKASQ